MLVAENIHKRYGAHIALRDVSASFAPGEVVALVGENGAGKSTLLKVLAAVHSRDGGRATLDGQPYAPANQREAEARGVALVFQELNVNRAVSIAENIMLGRLRSFRRGGLIHWRRLNEAAQAVLDRIGAEFSVRDAIDRLDLGQIKTIEVARALAADPRFVFFDESTAFLGRAEAARLMRVIGELRAQDIGVVFVSHHLNEVFEIADRLVVLKDGALVGAYPTPEVTEEQLHRLMVGRDLADGLFPQRVSAVPGPVAARVQDLRTRSGLGPVTLSLHAGEVVGIGGLKGSGGEALIGALAGAEPILSGEMEIAGEKHRPALPQAAWDRGVALLPGDRTGEGALVDFSVRENVTLATRPRRWGVFDDRATGRRQASEQVASLGVRTTGIEAPVGALSGGNMQKVVLGKCLAAAPRILLLNNPTRGVDVGAKSEIYRVIRRLAEGGTAVLMVTEDLPELLGLSDRIVVTRAGRISRGFGRDAWPSEEEVVRWMM
ncbi:MAG: sugar ABC transporter ATP-binding protein [Geminicoccaceae bacterium]|nr:MAG: sugar ABC transporter ATP-binding protein [Geminicoccaceae bacterium]